MKIHFISMRYNHINNSRYMRRMKDEKPIYYAILYCHIQQCRRRCIHSLTHESHFHSQVSGYVTMKWHPMYKHSVALTKKMEHTQFPLYH